MIPKPAEARENTSTLLPFNHYDCIIVSFSGGKDSLACALHLLDQGVPADRIELWHQSIDGRPGSTPFFDWPCTESYCAAFGQAYGLPTLFQWKEGGFAGEMLRNNVPTAPTTFELRDHTTMTVGGRGPLGTRMKFPQVTADLSKRWCSAYLKIDVATKALTNDPRFDGAKVLMLTGERRQESANRARYPEVERHKSTTRNRRVDQWRAVIAWEEEMVWEIIERYRVRPHPAYLLGWSRLSCMPCIFGNPDQWASVRAVAPQTFDQILAYEHAFGVTIRRDGDVARAAAAGEVTIPPGSEETIRLAMSRHYPVSLARVPDSERWVLPRGAYKHSGGPT